MLNDAQRTSLRIVMSLIEEKMRDIEARLASPEEHGRMFDICHDLAPDVQQALRLTVAEVYALIPPLRDRLALPREVKPASREILKGLYAQFLPDAQGGIGLLPRLPESAPPPRSQERASVFSQAGARGHAQAPRQRTVHCTTCAWRST